MASHNDIGRRGEEIACRYLIDKGHTIIAQNYRYRRAEVDIISKIQDCIVFTEVKTRSYSDFGYPEEAVDALKKKKMREAMNHYLEENNSKEEPRFDIIAITLIDDQIDIHHIEDAFFH